MNPKGIRGAPAKLFIALLLAVTGLAAYYRWTTDHGVFGHVDPVPFDTKDYICFLERTANGYDLFIVKADGTGEKELTNDGNPKRSPAWSPDGKSLAYVASSSKDRSRSYQVMILGQGTPKVATYGSSSKDAPLFSPDGKRIAYMVGGAIKVMKANGDDLDQLYPPPHRGRTSDEEGQDHKDEEGKRLPPVTAFLWSPLGDAILGKQLNEGEAAMVMGKGGWWNEEKVKAGGGAQVLQPETIFILPEDTEKPRLVAAGDRVEMSWFPDGKRAAVALGADGRSGLAIMRVDEANLPSSGRFASERNLLSAEKPQVSPDGSKIAFELWRLDGAAGRRLVGIHVVPAEEGEAIRIRNAKEADGLRPTLAEAGHEPQWSPDGTRLLYWVDGPESRNYKVANADGTGARVVRGEKQKILSAVWSPAR